MNLIFFTHPQFLHHQSMPRFSNMLVDGMVQRGHTVDVWFPRPNFYNIPVKGVLKKWLGYIDQYIIFPLAIRNRIRKLSPDTLFVFTDHALGPWVPLVADRPHVIHCHDFLAQQSALGKIAEHSTSWTGRQYQRMIRNGYSKGRNFISVSKNTRTMLHQFLPALPQRSEVVYNGLNQAFEPAPDPHYARAMLGNETGLNLTHGYLLHVGGNQWYKNREGVIEIYNAWRTLENLRLPLLLVGEIPNTMLMDVHAKSPYKADIHFLSNVDDKILREAYVGASVFLFPSKAEGFGWPIAEAMASGSPVITTNDAPMTEVAGDAGFLIPRKPTDKSLANTWALEAAQRIHEILKLSSEERHKVIRAGLNNAKRFDTQTALDRIAKIYTEILQQIEAK